MYVVGKKYRIVDIDEHSAFSPDLPRLKGKVVTILEPFGWHGPDAVTMELEEPPAHWDAVVTIYRPTLEEIPMLTMNDFQVGMRVHVKGKVKDAGNVDETGTIIVIADERSGDVFKGQNIGVEFDDLVSSCHTLHYCGREQCPSGRGLWVEPHLITILDTLPNLDAFELAWSDYLDQDGNPDHKEAFQAGWEARGGVK